MYEAYFREYYLLLKDKSCEKDRCLPSITLFELRIDYKCNIV